MNLVNLEWAGGRGREPYNLRLLGAPGFKGLRLTAGRPEKHQCSTCCHDFRNRAAWNPYKTSKNTWFF